MRACVRSCVSAWGRCSSTLEPRTARNATPAAIFAFHILMTGTWVLRCFSWEACYTHGLFDQYCDILVICMGFKLLCGLFVRSWWYTHGLFDLYWGILAICMGFKLLCSLVVRSWWYTRGLFDLCADILALCMGFKLLCSLCVRSWCYLHGLFDLYSDILAICMGFKHHSSDILAIISTIDFNR